MSSKTLTEEQNRTRPHPLGRVRYSTGINKTMNIDKRLKNLGTIGQVTMQLSPPWYTLILQGTIGLNNFELASSAKSIEEAIVLLEGKLNEASDKLRVEVPSS